MINFRASAQGKGTVLLYSEGRSASHNALCAYCFDSEYRIAGDLSQCSGRIAL